MSCHVLCVVYRADLEHDVIKPVTKGTVGQILLQRTSNGIELELLPWYQQVM